MSPTLSSFPVNTGTLAMGLILFQPVVTTWSLNLKVSTANFYETLGNKKNINKTAINIHMQEKNCLNSQNIFTGMKTYGF